MERPNEAKTMKAQFHKLLKILGQHFISLKSTLPVFNKSKNTFGKQRASTLLKLAAPQRTYVAYSFYR